MTNTPEQTPLLEAINIGHTYESQSEPILKDINFSLSSGDSLGILGPNGGGKTTLLKIMVGLIKPTSGYFKFNGKILDYKNSEFRKQIGHVPQTTQLNPSLPVRVRDMIEFVLEKNTPHKKELIHQLLCKVGLESKEEASVHLLSGGEKKRALLARAMIHNPTLLVLDELTAGLDSTGQDQLLELILRLQKDQKTSFIIVDHNINQIIKHCDKILCLNRTSHWHQEKDYLTRSVLESIYHCEFEHLLLHEKFNAEEGKKELIPHHHHHRDER